MTPVKIVLVYQSLLGIYGDRGNAMVLLKRLQWRGIEATLTVVDPGDEVPATGSVYLLGGGEDAAQVSAVKALKADGNLFRALDDGATLFAVCAGYQICGNTFTIGGIAEVIEGLGFPAPAPIPVLAVEHQIAQKLHACTTPDRHGGNERAHDLVDLQILIAAEPPDLHELATIGRRLFAARRVAPWPPTVQAWPGWDTRYAEAADGLDVRPLDDAIAWINTLITEAEHSTETGL